VRTPEAELMDLPEEAQAYARADFAGVHQAFVDRLMELAGSLDRSKAVDLGTGPGDIPLRVWRARPGWKIVAVDAAVAMLDIARPLIRAAGAEGNIRLVLGDAKETGLAGASFDIVFSNSILHHVSDAPAFWREMKRLGKPGAVLFLRDLARPLDLEGARGILEKHTGGASELLREEFYRSLLAAYRVEEVREQLAEAGLEMLNLGMSSDRHLDVWGRIP
jgi:ubiquinone/menaquinone biosynthesis C-methylase UbiE